MGQQQLILLVLAVVIVGIAIVVGIRAFTENSAKANADAMMQDAVRIANDMQAWYKKPAPFGGRDTGEDWSDATLAKAGYAVDTDGVYTNLNGEFTATVTAAGAVITGVRFVDGSTTDEENEVVVAVCGTSDEDILGAITLLGTQDTGATAPTCTTTP